MLENLKGENFRVCLIENLCLGMFFGSFGPHEGLGGPGALESVGFEVFQKSYGGDLKPCGSKLRSRTLKSNASC